MYNLPSSIQYWHAFGLFTVVLAVTMTVPPLAMAADRQFGVHRRLMHDAPADFADGVLVASDPAESGGAPRLRLSVPGKSQLAAARGVYTSPVVLGDTPFNEVLLSWNVDVSPQAGFVVEARLGTAESWTPFLRFGAGGPKPPRMETQTTCSAGRVEVDVFRSSRHFDRLQYRLHAQGDDEQRPDVVGIDRLCIVLSDTTVQRPSSAAAVLPQERLAPSDWQRRLPVPFRSQRSAPDAIAGEVCSPTSLSMVLAYRGCPRPIAEVAERVFDHRDRLYGNWPNAAQTAYQYGVPAYITRITAWSEVESMIAAGQPLIISVTAEADELAGAPYRRTNGHLLVITGFDSDGNVLVNDPAGRSEAEGMVTYRRSDLTRVWLEAKAGTAYVLEARPGYGTAPVGSTDEPLVDVAGVIPGIVLDIRYATADNFTRQPLYPSARCLLRRSVAERLARVQQRLSRQGYGLKIFDGYRPVSAQAKMWLLVSDPRYVANPARGSRHNRGAAVDVALVDATGAALEMPTEFDDFTAAARRDDPGGTEASRRHRQILSDAMNAEGFTGLASEWWHFDAPDWQKYPIVDMDLTALTATPPAD